MTEKTTKNPGLYILLFFFFSGISGLMYETVWMRMLIRVFGVTLDAVSTILTIFMAGLAAGSFLAAKTRFWTKKPLFFYGIIELGIAVSAVCSTLLIKYLPEIAAGYFGGLSGIPLLAARA